MKIDIEISARIKFPDHMTVRFFEESGLKFDTIWFVNINILKRQKPHKLERF